jgi:hypothetical protein
VGSFPVHEGEPGSRLLIVVPLLLPASETQIPSQYSIPVMYSTWIIPVRIMKNSQEYCYTRIPFSLAPDPNDMLEYTAQTIFPIGRWYSENLCPTKTVQTCLNPQQKFFYGRLSVYVALYNLRWMSGFEPRELAVTSRHATYSEKLAGLIIRYRTQPISFPLSRFRNFQELPVTHATGKYVQ